MMGEAICMLHYCGWCPTKYQFVAHATAWLAATPFGVKVHMVKRELSFNHSALCIQCMQAQFIGIIRGWGWGNL